MLTRRRMDSLCRGADGLRLPSTFEAVLHLVLASSSWRSSCSSCNVLLHHLIVLVRTVLLPPLLLFFLVVLFVLVLDVRTSSQSSSRSPSTAYSFTHLRGPCQGLSVCRELRTSRQAAPFYNARNDLSCTTCTDDLLVLRWICRF